MVRKVVFLGLWFALSSQVWGGYINQDGELPEFDALYGKISSTFSGQCPATVFIGTSSSPNTSQFNVTRSEILIHPKTQKRINTIAHETIHLCLHKLSDGASITSKFRFIDEGYATYFGNALTQPENEIRAAAFGKARKYLDKQQVSFEQVMDWPAYFGNAGRGGSVSWDAYYVGLTFYLFIKDTYGEDKFFKLVEEIGSSLTFNRALKAALGKTDNEVETAWLEYIRSQTTGQPS